MDRLIYNECYETIDKNLSFSNAGGRKGRSVRDHLFVVHSIYNEVINGKAPSADFQFMDVKKML